MNNNHGIRPLIFPTAALPKKNSVPSLEGVCSKKRQRHLEMLRAAPRILPASNFCFSPLYHTLEGFLRNNKQQKTTNFTTNLHNTQGARIANI